MEAESSSRRHAAGFSGRQAACRAQETGASFETGSPRLRPGAPNRANRQPETVQGERSRAVIVIGCLLIQRSKMMARVLLTACRREISSSCSLRMAARWKRGLGKRTGFYEDFAYEGVFRQVTYRPRRADLHSLEQVFVHMLGACP